MLGISGSPTPIPGPLTCSMEPSSRLGWGGSFLGVPLLLLAILIGAPQEMGHWEGEGGESAVLQENPFHLQRQTPFTETALAGQGGEGELSPEWWPRLSPLSQLSMPVQTAQSVLEGRGWRVMFSLWISSQAPGPDWVLGFAPEAERYLPLSSVWPARACP